MSFSLCPLTCLSLCVVGTILDYVIQPVPIDLPLLHPNTTRLTHVACGRAHTVIVTDIEGGTGTNMDTLYYNACCFLYFTV